MSETDHDWNAILKCASIPSLLCALALWKLGPMGAWISLGVSIALTIVMGKYYAKKRSELFSAITLVAAVFLLALALKRFEVF